MVDPRALLADLQEQVRLLEVDLRRQVDDVAEHARTLRAEVMITYGRNRK